MKGAIIYDNTACNEDLQSGWGFSCLLDQRILFDTGENPESLFHNLNQLKVDISKIEAVVISHDHWDHTGGLWELLKKRKNIRIYGCPGFSLPFKNQVRKLGATLIEAKTFQEINQWISVTGEIPGEYNHTTISEQALIINKDNVITVITGCSHPGIIKIIQKVKGIFPEKKISLAFGGFHLLYMEPQMIRTIVSAMKEMGVEKVGPTHCTGQEAQMIFKETFGDHFVSIEAGKTLEI